MNLLLNREPNPPPWSRSWAQDNSSRAAGQRFLEKIQNGEKGGHGGRSFTLDWLECLGCRRSFNNFIGSLHFWVIIEEKVIYQHWLSRKIAQTCLEVLLLLYNLHILASDQKSFCFFEQLMSNFRYRKQLLVLSWATFDNILERLQETFWKSRTTCGKP